MSRSVPLLSRVAEQDSKISQSTELFFYSIILKKHTASGNSKMASPPGLVNFLSKNIFEAEVKEMFQVL